MIAPQHRWLLDKIIERFLAAEAVEEGFRRWRAEPPDTSTGIIVTAVDSPPATADENLVAAVLNDKSTAHITMNDPEFVMASCRGELGIIDKHRDTSTRTATGTTVQICHSCNTPYPCPTLRSLHLAYCTRDGWTPW